MGFGVRRVETLDSGAPTRPTAALAAEAED
jgi:hypothetical protein